MGLDIHIHAGAYVVIKAPPVVLSVDTHVCSSEACTSMSARNQAGNFCSVCGSPIVKKRVESTRAATLYSLLPDRYCDDLSWVAREDNLDVILAIGNRNNDGTSIGDIDAEGGATINEITPDMPARFIAAFNVEYADVLAVLRERATSVDVKFGVLTWWS